MKSYFRALSFLTIIPLPFVHLDPEGQELSGSAVCFPLVGITIGALFAALAWLLLHLFPIAPVAIIILISGFFFTRGLHFDGLADTADGLIGTTSREKAFKAMEDSAIGVMGAAAIFFVYLLKFTLLVEFGSQLLVFVLLFMPLAGRWALVNAGTWFRPARHRGLGDLFLRGLRWPVLLKASLLSAALLFLFACRQTELAIPVLSGCLLGLAAGFLLSLYAAHRLGGISGDILGACCELAELFFLIGFYLALHGSAVTAFPAKVVILYAGVI